MKEEFKEDLSIARVILGEHNFSKMSVFWEEKTLKRALFEGKSILGRELFGRRAQKEEHYFTF